jgi:hypothetical protein
MLSEWMLCCVECGVKKRTLCILSFMVLLSPVAYADPLSNLQAFSGSHTGELAGGET